MYTYELDSVDGNEYCIYNPDGDYICFVTTKSEAQALISHLNRE